MILFTDIVLPAIHVREVGADRIIDLVEVAVPAVAGHAVVPAAVVRGVQVMIRGVLVVIREVPVVHSQNRRSAHHIQKNVDHVRQKIDLALQSRRSQRKTIIAGTPVRSAILKLLTDKLVVGDKHFGEL